MIRRPRCAPVPRSHHRIADLRERSGFRPEPLEPRKLLAVVAWDGDAGDGDFGNPLNWDGDVLPGPNDDAIIDPGAGPFIELKAGDSFSLKTLLANWPLAVNGTLGVAEDMAVGEVFFDIGPFGRLDSNNIHIQPGTGGIWNQGEWTIRGTSVVERRILSDGQLRLATDAQVTLGPGLGAAQQRGIFEIRAGSMTIGHNAALTGVTMDEPQLIVQAVLNVEGAAAFTGLRLDADGASTSDQVRIYFDPLLASTFTGSRLRLEFALITGAVEIAASDVLVAGRAILTGNATIEGGVIENRGMILVRPPLAAPSQSSSLAISDADITMNHSAARATRLYGNITVTDSEIGITRTARLGNGLTLRGVEITRVGSGFTRSWWTIEGSLTASDLTTSGHAILWIRDGATLTLDGGSNAINNQLLVYDGGRIDWTGGDLEILVPDSSSANLSLIGSTGALRASFTGPDSHSLTITGSGPLRLGGELSVAFADPAAELVINGKIRNSGTIEITGGTLRHETGLISPGDVVWRTAHGGEWIVGAGGTLEIDEAFTDSRVNLTIVDDGQAPFLSGVTLNTGTITLVGEGQWPGGSATPLTLRNWGQIRKIGDGLRTLPGSITNLVHGAIAVESGQLEIDSPLFINRGALTIGSDQYMSPRAVFRTTGDYREGGHARLEILGAADGDPDDLPRFGVGGAMSLAGEVVISLTTTTPFTQGVSWQLGFASGGRIGEFASTQVTVPGFHGALFYTGQRLLVMIEV